MAKDPQAVAQKWANNLSGATQAIRDGVASVTVAPGAAAARQKAVYLQNVQASADKWARNVQSVTLADWQSAMTEKGINRIGAGATAAQPKMAQFLTSFLPYVDNIARQLPARGTLDQNIARMVQQVRGNANFPGARGGR